MGSRVESREGFIYGFLRTELPRLEVSRVKIGGISSPDLGRLWIMDYGLWELRDYAGIGVNLWEVQGFLCFSIQELSFVQTFHLK